MMLFFSVVVHSFCEVVITVLLAYAVLVCEEECCVCVCGDVAGTQLTAMTRQNKLEAMNHIADHEVGPQTACSFLC